MKRFSLLTLFLVLLQAMAWPARTAPVRDGQVEAELISSVDAVQPGTPFQVALRLRMDEHWHTYWRYAGDTGLPTSLRWELPDGFEAGPLQWPYPERFLIEGLMNLGYEGEVLLLVDVTPPANLPGETVTLKARADWLVCKEVCLPGGADLELTLPVSSEPPGAAHAELFREARARLPAASEAWQVTVAPEGDRLVFTLVPGPGAAENVEHAFFLPYAYGWVNVAPEQEWARTGDGYQLTVARDTTAEERPEKLEGILVYEPGWLENGKLPALEVSLTPGAAAASSPPATPEAEGLPLSMLLAFVGGLILNLMPCVFPVLGIKIMGFVQQAGEDRGKVARHGLIFTLGVLVSFWVLSGLLIGLRAGGQELGWGFQLQSPHFVWVLTLLLFIFALNLSGVFEVGLGLTGAGSGLAGQSGFSGSFFSGVLATLVATPCAAPILAPALGAALILPPAASVVVFTCMALGLALPYLLLSLFPGALRFLPRPGAWMETFKQSMAFLLYASAGYLVWVLAGQGDERGLLKILFALVIVAVGAWVLGKWTGYERTAAVRRTATVIALAVLLGGGWMGWKALTPSELTWDKWSQERVERLVEEGQTVYVDFTARWCATCQVNKSVVFDDQAVIDEMQKRKIALLKADWTNQDPEITRALAAFGRSAVPFNLIYDARLDEPIILPELLTPGIVLDALRSLDGGKS